MKEIPFNRKPKIYSPHQNIYPSIPFNDEQNIKIQKIPEEFSGILPFLLAMERCAIPSPTVLAVAVPRWGGDSMKTGTSVELWYHPEKTIARI
jgi:hypothetical protein